MFLHFGFIIIFKKNTQHDVLPVTRPLYTDQLFCFFVFLLFSTFFTSVFPKSSQLAFKESCDAWSSALLQCFMSVYVTFHACSLVYVYFYPLCVSQQLCEWNLFQRRGEKLVLHSGEGQLVIWSLTLTSISTEDS